jgi:hypothetical protein
MFGIDHLIKQALQATNTTDPHKKIRRGVFILSLCHCITVTLIQILLEMGSSEWDFMTNFSAGLYIITGFIIVFVHISKLLSESACFD